MKNWLRSCLIMSTQDGATRLTGCSRPTLGNIRARGVTKGRGLDKYRCNNWLIMSLVVMDVSHLIPPTPTPRPPPSRITSYNKQYLLQTNYQDLQSHTLLLSDNPPSPYLNTPTPSTPPVHTNTDIAPRTADAG